MHMTNVNIDMDLPSIERTFKNTQICFLHTEQQCLVGDIFSISFNNELRYYKTIDVWSVPKDFVIKFLWRMCGMESGEQLLEKFNNINGKIFVHFYTHIPSGTLQNLVKL
jgi:hypothetical protein